MGKKTPEKGFTIVELLIASAVFSVVLLIATAGLLQIGRVYYKGVTSSQTQEAARSIIEDVSRTVQFNGGNVLPFVNPDSDRPEAPSSICIGNKRYTYVLNNQRIAAPEALGPDQSRHVLAVGDCTGSVPPLNDDNLAGGARELMPPHMRLTKFNIIEAGPGLYQITVRVVSGHKDVLKDTDTTTDGPDMPGECIASSLGGQFCAISELSTTVQKRVK